MNKLQEHGNRCVLYGRETLGTLQVTDSVMFHGAEIAGSEQRVSGVAPHLHFAATELFG